MMEHMLNRSRQFAVITIMIVVGLQFSASYASTKAEDMMMKGTALSMGSAEPGIVLDTSSGNYIVTYEMQSVEGKPMLFRLIYEPATKISPTIISKYWQLKSGAIIYEYKIRNSNNAKQALLGIRLSTTNADNASQLAPLGWEKGITSSYADGATYVNWSYKRGEDITSGLKPGKTQAGFSYESSDLPGVDIVRAMGATRLLAVGGEGPFGAIGEEFEKLLRNTKSVSVLAASAKIKNPNPFNASIVLGSLQKHVQELIDMEQIDPAFATQLDRLFVTAIAAVDNGNLVAARTDIKEIRRLVNIERKTFDKDNKDSNKGNGLITRLASSVLIFNLKYVEKRLKDSSDT